MKQQGSRKNAPILIHQDELGDTGIEICVLSDLAKTDQAAHRDDHYMFMIQGQGYFLWELDFRTVRLEGSSVCFVAPGQVHRYIDFEQAEGWLVFVDAALITAQSREIFNNCLHICQHAAITAEDEVFRLLLLLQAILKKELLPLRKALIASLTAALGTLIASGLVRSEQSLASISSKKRELMSRFRQLVTEKCRELKSVKDYAQLMHLSRVYLNEVSKTTTGFPASYWIDQEILLEAKRLLYYTGLEVRQIAYQLGYEDQAYFSRFFKKHSGMTAVAFRNAKP